ncbi:LacI family DNA-binding transcriptional regulator [Microbacterium sp. NPDC028030]|uniref:LacI family DNA-binding transcriptional regulator n=1 Tax=Microbacterium sp. NPDC028030 TaxID=3155124 RepID=UPI0033DF1B0A
MSTSLADVARISGVSTATVSHVINGTRYVSPSTIEKVQRAIASTGYRPNPYARALRTATSESIGFVASDVANTYSTSVMRGIAGALRTRGYTLLVANADEDPALEREAIEALVERMVDGLIVAPTTSTDPISFEQIEEIGVPVVLVDRAVPLDLDQVLVENVDSVAEVVGQMLDAGHRRIAVVGGRAGHSTTTERMQGWRKAHTDRGLVCDESLAVLDVFDASRARHATERLFARENRPTALFSMSNVMSLGILRALSDLRLVIPRDVSFAAFDDIEWIDLLDHPVTCLAQPTEEVGSNAVELVLTRIANPAVEHRVVRLAPSLCDRGSIAEPPRGRRTV